MNVVVVEVKFVGMNIDFDEVVVMALVREFGRWFVLVMVWVIEDICFDVNIVWVVVGLFIVCVSDIGLVIWLEEVIVWRYCFVVNREWGNWVLDNMGGG